jgi:Tfp pilus assembly ATPase PilU
MGEVQGYIQKGRELGMQTFDQHLVELVQSGKISIETARLHATNPADLDLMLTIEA